MATFVAESVRVARQQHSPVRTATRSGVGEGGRDGGGAASEDGGALHRRRSVEDPEVGGSKRASRTGVVKGCGWSKCGESLVVVSRWWSGEVARAVERKKGLFADTAEND